MKTLLIAVTLTLSTSAFADKCVVSLIDSRGVVTDLFYTFQDNQCMNAVRNCRNHIVYQSMNGATCVVTSRQQDGYSPNPYPYPYPETDYRPRPQPRPTPTPTPEPQRPPTRPTEPTYPTPRPTPTTGTPPQSGTNGQTIPAPRENRPPRSTLIATMTREEESSIKRAVEVGETVIVDNKYYVVSDDTDNTYEIKSVKDRKVVTDVLRGRLAVTRGCAYEICATDSVYDIANSQFVAIAAVHFDGLFVTKSIDGRNTLRSNVSNATLAVTKGCVQSSYGDSICVGATMQARDNSYYKVVAVQKDGKVVVESADSNRSVVANVDPATFVVVR